MARINNPAEEPSRPDGLPGERLAPKLTEAQRHTILKYADLPASLAERLLAQPDERGCCSRSMSWMNSSTGLK
jgi:hypothetical protein